ncbi:MAG: arylesterase [Deltaproteobacteria bacterium]|nr:arylesterase [Deltaproteobacteria bacterium]
MRTLEGASRGCTTRGVGARWRSRSQRGYCLATAPAWAARSTVAPGVGRAWSALALALSLAGLVLALGGCSQDADSARSPAKGPARGAAASAAARPDAAQARPVLLFLGTSLTAGYGLPSEQAYPALIQRHIDDAGLDYRVVNAGVSGDTSAGGLRRLDWLLRLPVAVLVLELGSNDMLRGLDVDDLRSNLDAIVRETRARHPELRLVVAGMRAVPNLGAAYVTRFEAVFPTLAEQNAATLIPFLLEGVAGDPALNLADGIHPNAEGHRHIAASIWPRIEPVLAR